MVQITLIQTGKKQDMQKAIIFFMILGTLSSGKCSKDDLQIERKNYSGANLRIDGVYYNNHQKAHFFLYRDGVFFDGGTGFNGSINELIKFYSQKENYRTAYELPYRWGVFKIENDEILIEKWVSGDAFGRYITSKFSGVIINDTTLLLNHPAEVIGTDTFYFHKFSPKPDSTNTFIK